MEKILITGASGFIGSFVVEEALRRGLEVWAALRKTSSRAFLGDERIHTVELRLDDEKQMEEALLSVEPDYVVHCAGVTKSLRREDFFRVNTEGTRHLVRALQRLPHQPRRLVYLSSLSIFGPIREEQPYAEICESDRPQPNTAYGKSKLQAEQFLDAECRIPYVVLRPTGVYGPRERDYFLMAKSIKAHSDFAVGYRRQDITFVYVKDVVQAVFLALERGENGRKYFLSDGEVYQSAAFSQLIRRELGNPWCLRITAPIWVLRLVSWGGEAIGHLTGKISALNNDKYHIMRQRNWRCDITPAMDELGFKPEYQLERGVKETIRWYKENGWL